MGLLDSVIGALGQSQGGGGGGGQAAILNAVIGMLTHSGGGGGGGGGGAGAAGGLGSLGGLGGLVEQFTRNGMGDAVKSWVGSGQNMPVSADQISQGMGSDMLGQLAQQLGMGHGDLAGQLSQMLPQVVDKLTPNGQLPQGNDLGGLGDLGSLLGGLLKR